MSFLKDILSLLPFLVYCYIIFSLIKDGRKIICEREFTFYSQSLLTFLRIKKPREEKFIGQAAYIQGIGQITNGVFWLLAMVSYIGISYFFSPVLGGNVALCFCVSGIGIGWICSYIAFTMK
jgi:hypothetical protein